MFMGDLMCRSTWYAYPCAHILLQLLTAEAESFGMQEGGLSSLLYGILHGNDLWL